jgi:hypothetical protein
MRRLDIARLPSQTAERDQASFGAIDVALAGEQIGMGRPLGYCAGAVSEG